MPTTDRPQHMRALDKAARHRSERSRVKRELFAITSTARSRERCAEILLEDPPAHLVTMRVVDLIAACRGTGPKRARQMLRQAGVRETKVVGQLSVDQALAIGGRLRSASGEQMELAS